jgi:hypothetical protein
MTAKPVIFVSHAAEDESVALAIKTLLAKASAGAVNVFVSSDVKDKRYGDDWMLRIGERVSGAALVLYLASHNSLAGHWTQLEVGSALFRSPRPPIVSICINGLKVEQLPDPWRRFEASELRTADELQATVTSVLRHCRPGEELAPGVDWPATLDRLLDEQEEWLTTDHGLYSACSTTILPHLERVLAAGLPDQNTDKLYQALIEYVLQSMTFDGSPIDDRFWTGTRGRPRRSWLISCPRPSSRSW